MIINNDIEFELEDFLKGEMEQSKMTPSASVWANINKEIQPKYRWAFWSLTFIMMLVPSSLVMYYLPVKTNTLIAVAESAAYNSTNNTDNNSLDLSGISPDKSVVLHHSSINKEEAITATDNADDTYHSTVNNMNENSVENKSLSVDLNTVNLLTDLMKVSTVKNVSLSVLPNKIAKQNIADNNLADVKKQNNKSSKLTMELYVTPSISFRTMRDDKTRLDYYRNIYRNNAFTDNIAAKNVNTVINQKAATGKEIGIGTRYAISSKLKLKAGLQFNISQFTTEAYKTTGVANFAFVKNNKLDSVSDNALFASAGTDKVTLTNSIYQLSLPIGIQWDCIKKNNFSIGIATSLQPSYLLQDNSYVLSTDYQYFSKGNKFSRQWNLNSSVDVSFNFTNKAFTWYMAPQFRYQLLTTYQDIYSIKEHRWDLGLKVGVFKTF